MEYLEEYFEFVPLRWNLYQDSNGFFGYQDHADKDRVNVKAGKFSSKQFTWYHFKFMIDTAAKFLLQQFDVSSIDETITHKWRDILLFTKWI